MDAAREAGCKIIHCPIVFDKVRYYMRASALLLSILLLHTHDAYTTCEKKGHKEISNDAYGILAGVKDGEAFTAGEWGSQICESMTPQADDIVVKGKSGLCGFHSTNLDFLLRQNNIKNVVLAGYLTNCCVESSMRSAYERGYKVYTLKDCCAATSIAGQEAAFEYTFGMFSTPTTSSELLSLLKSPVSVSQ